MTTGFTTLRTGFLSRPALFTSIINDMAANGFTPKYYNLGTLSDASPDITATKAIFEASSTVDPLQSTQPWRICIDGTVPGGQILVGTSNQLLDDGTTYRITGAVVAANNVTVYTDACGLIGHAGTDKGITVDANITNASPYSYNISITDRGIAFEVFQEITFSGNRTYSWVCVQRLVDPITGNTVFTGKTPVCALYSCDSGLTAKFIVVRELDVIAPSQSVVVSEYSDYVNKVINVSKQNVLAETNQYYIIFPSGFNTARHLYNSEMDMMAYTNAGVLSQGNTALVNVYGRGSLKFNSGNTEPVLHDILKLRVPASNGDAILGTVCQIVVDSGTWETGDAAGTIYLYNLTGGAFVSTIVVDNVSHTKDGIFTVETDSQFEYRSYLGGNANIPDNEGMRCLYLTDGGGITK